MNSWQRLKFDELIQKKKKKKIWISDFASKKICNFVPKIVENQNKCFA